MDEKSTTLNDNPQIAELLEVLENNGLTKEKKEVKSLVNYIGDMEDTLTSMLNEIREMRTEVNRIHDTSLRGRCEHALTNIGGKITHALTFVKKAKDNLISSASHALKEFREKGKTALKEAVKKMKIPETLDRLAGVFHQFSESVKEDAHNLESARDEISKAKSHMSNAKLYLFGKQRSDPELSKNYNGIFAKVQKLCEKMGKAFDSMEKKTLGLADKIRADRVRESVKEGLDYLKGNGDNKSFSAPTKDNVR